MPIYVIGGPILHIDRALTAGSANNTRKVVEGSSDPTLTPGVRGDDRSNPWLKTYADWVAMSVADTLLVSASGYGMTAAWAGGVPQVYQLRLGSEETCQWQSQNEVRR